MIGLATFALCVAAGSSSAQSPGQSKTQTKPPSRKPASIVFATEPSPPKAGDAEFRVTVKDSEGGPITQATVSILLVMPSMPEMRTEVRLSSIGSGVFRGAGQFEMSGRWDVTITVTPNGERSQAKRLLVVVR